MMELIIRRGTEYWEWRFREEQDDKFRTTKIPVRPECDKPAHCKWCDGLLINGTRLEFPVQLLFWGGAEHVITPPLASHLVAMEWCQANPNEPCMVGWELTQEDVQAGKKGALWPEPGRT